MDAGEGNTILPEIEIEVAAARVRLDEIYRIKGAVLLQQGLTLFIAINCQR